MKMVLRTFFTLLFLTTSFKDSLVCGKSLDIPRTLRDGQGMKNANATCKKECDSSDYEMFDYFFYDETEKHCVYVCNITTDNVTVKPPTTLLPIPTSSNTTKPFNPFPSIFPH